MNATLDAVKTSPVNMEDRQALGIRAGDTVRVHQKIQDKGKTRIQIFDGLVLTRKHGNEPGATFTVRKVASGVGVEKIYPLYSPLIDKIEIVKRAKVRRAKLYYIREKVAREVKRQMRRMSFADIATESDIEATARAEQEANAAEEAEAKTAEEKAAAEASAADAQAVTDEAATADTTAQETAEAPSTETGVEKTTDAATEENSQEAEATEATETASEDAPTEESAGTEDKPAEPAAEAKTEDATTEEKTEDAATAETPDEEKKEK